MRPEAAEPIPECASHLATLATATCERCGRFACAACIRGEAPHGLCLECFAREDVRLAASPRARRALWLAVFGLHGAVVLLPVAFWSAKKELLAIDRGEAPAAGAPWARGAISISAVGAVAWLILAMLATRSLFLD